MKDTQNKIDRRNFLKTIGAAGLTSAFAQVTKAQPNEAGAGEKQKPKFPQVPKRKLGKSNVEVPCLSLGTIFNVVENQIILKKCLQWGVNFWDTAPDYSGPNSELGIGKFIANNPQARKKLFIATKASDAVTVEDVEKRLQESLKRLNTKYIDLYHIMDLVMGQGYNGHGLSDPAQLTDELKEWVKSAKKRKLIRLFGFPTHKNMAKCLAAAARLDWIDVIMTRYNYQLMQDEKMQAAIDACHKAGIGLVAMKTQGLWPRGGGDKKLANHFLERGFTEEQAKIKVVLEDKRFSSACVRMENVAILTANVAAVLDKTKLSQVDRDVFKQYATSCSGYCTGCADICESALPEVSCVSDIMRYLMYYNSYGDRDRARELFAEIPAPVRAKLLSTGYRVAEARCPQNLPIAELVAEAVDKLA